jgi:hypothetical protein
MFNPCGMSNLYPILPYRVPPSGIRSEISIEWDLNCEHSERHAEILTYRQMLIELGMDLPLLPED